MFYLLLAAFLWGTSFVAGKIAYGMADEGLIVLFRMIISSALLVPLTVGFFSRQKNAVLRINLSKSDWLKLWGLSFLMTPLTLILQFFGLGLTSASSAVTIIGIEPITIAVIGVLFFKTRASFVIWLTGILAFLGILTMVGFDTKNISVLGCFLVFLSTIVVAFWVRYSEIFLQKIPVKYFTALTLQMGLISGLPLILLLVKDWRITPSIDSVAAVLYLGIGCSLLASLFWNKGLNLVPSNQSGVFLALEPVFGVLMAVVLLNEHIGVHGAVGAAMVVIAATICLLTPNKKSE